MQVKRIPDFKYFLLIVMILSGIVGGGYFCYASAAMSVLLMAAVFYQLFRVKRLQAACDINFLAFFLISGGYFLTCLWAIDSGMALMGAMKFLPVFLFFLLICQITEEQRQELIGWLPALGSVMTILSYVMMQVPALESLVSTAGRLGGFFQYPNTYALFMLVCFIVAAFRLEAIKRDWLHAVHCLIALLGIFWSGSRTVFVLLLICIFALPVLKKKNKKYLFLCIGSFAVIALLFLLLGGSDLTARLTTFSGNASTFWGRLLYAQDALKIIRKHPFGMGYYGYYFVQQEMQTGVYSVVNVHNEFLQLALDVGMIPAICFYGAIGKSLLNKKENTMQEIRNKLVLLVVFLHSLFDYDFQFFVIYCVLMLFLDLKNKKEVKLSAVSAVTAGAALLAVGAGAFVTGVSDFLYIQNHPEQAVRFYSGNTMAKIFLLTQADTPEEMERLADFILEENQHVPVAYSAKARAAISRGDTEEFVKYKLTAIRLGPYQREEYTDYMKTLAFCEQEYLLAGDQESAEYCLERAEEIAGMLKALEKNTSKLGWKIKDQPEVSISQEEYDLLEEMRGM